jgi:hypothetical protein
MPSEAGLDAAWGGNLRLPGRSYLLFESCASSVEAYFPNFLNIFFVSFQIKLGLPRADDTQMAVNGQRHAVPDRSPDHVRITGRVTPPQDGFFIFMQAQISFLGNQGTNTLVVRW